MYSKAEEDYLEAIHRIIERKGFVRQKDISRELDISPPSVTGMVQKLGEKGLVEYEKYGRVRLTEKGEKKARKIKNRHEVMKEFLQAILISEKTAEKDACNLEHEISQETFEQIRELVRFMGAKEEWVRDFQRFCKND